MKNNYHIILLAVISALLVFGSPFFQNQILNMLFLVTIILASGWLMSLAEKDMK